MSTKYDLLRPLTEKPIVTSRYNAPKNLLVPEFEPKQSDIMSGLQGEIYKMDMNIPRSKLADLGNVGPPGAGDNEPEAGAVPTNNADETNPELSARDAVKQMMKTAFSNLRSTT